MVIKKYYENVITWLIKHAINRWNPVPRLVWHYVTTCICIDNMFLEQIEPILALPWNSMLVLVILIYSLRVYWVFFCILFCCDKNVIHFDVFIVPYNGNIKYNTNGTDSEMQLHYG